MPEITGPTLTLRPVAPADVPALRAIHATEEVARWWAQPAPGWPLAEDEPGLTILTMWRDGDVVGFIQFWEETDPRYRHAAIDLFVDPARHRQGIASEALRILVEDLIARRGHHRITIDPALDNAAAIACCDRHAVAIAAADEELLAIRDDDGRFTGYVLLAGIGNDHTGVELRRFVVTAPGRGVGRAALQQTLRRGFEHHATHRVWLDVRIDNHRARRLYEAAGLRTDGILRAVMRVDGRRHDQLLMSQLDREWHARRCG